MFVMVYGGQPFPLHSAQRLDDLEKASAASEPRWTTIRFPGDNAYGRFLLGGGIPVGITGLTQDDVPRPVVPPTPLPLEDSGHPFGTDRTW